MPEPKTRYTLSGPCANCPFRNDQESYLRPERVVEIGTDILNGKEFYCHKTTDHGEDHEGNPEVTVGSRTRVCGGAGATLAREGKDTQMERITRRLGLPVAEYDPEAPVYNSVAEWVRAKNGTPVVMSTWNGVTEVIEFEHCGVVGPDCEDPAGFMMGGGATSNLDEPMCDPTEGCSYCGAAMCPACTSDAETEYGHWCINCAVGEEEDFDE